jgi:ribosome-associated protein
MDIRKLQRAIVDGLEDVKAQGILVFDTEHLSSLFERVVIASGVSNRQTKALAASVRDAVKSQGFPVLSTEGESNGEWIIVDCGAAVVHVMQPAIRDFYHLEEIWGEKQVKLKMDNAPKKLVKAEEPAPVKKAPAAKAGAKKAAPARTAAKAPAQAPAKAPAKAPARKAPPARTAAKKAPVAAKSPARKPAAKKAPAKRAPSTVVTRVVGVKKSASSTTARKAAPARTPAKKTAARKTGR